MQGEVAVFPNGQALAESCAAAVADVLMQAVQDYGEASVALAGGSTPRRMYEVLAARYFDVVPWQSVHFFWSDERCVPPDQADSNFRVAQEALLSLVPAWQEKVHRLRGEAEPQAEAVRYSQRLIELFDHQLGEAEIVFDLMLLGMGADGHTASLFPGTDALSRSEPCLAVHALQGQPPGWRLSLSLPVINAARHVFISTAGAGKRATLDALRTGSADPLQYPVAAVAPEHGELRWFVDAAAWGV